MPFINVKTNIPVSENAQEALKTRLGQAIEAIPGKSEAWLMVGVEPECALWFQGTDAPAAGTITQYSQDNLEGVVFTVSGEEDVADLWQAMQSTQVRLLRGRSVPAPPVGGYYYEVSLTSADGGSTYSFGCDSSGELLILGGGYAIHGESNLLPALDALFADGAAE